MHKIFSFLVAILFVLVFDFFYFGAPPSASQDLNGSKATSSIAAFSDDGVEFSFGLMTPGQIFDPVTMLLLGSGLIGLAGLGRKKS